MKKSTKIILIISVTAILFGTVICSVAFFLGGSFNRQETEKVTHDTDAVFSLVSVDVTDPNVIVKMSTDRNCYAICEETEKISYSLTVDGDVLYLKEHDNRDWRDRIGVFFGGRTVVLYLPADKYDRLTINTSSGSIECKENILVFDNASLSSSSGSIEFSSSVGNALNAESKSGEIDIENILPESLSVSSLSGSIEIDNVHVSKKLEIESASGSIDVSNSFADSVAALSASGSVELEDCFFSGVMDIKTKSGSIYFDRCDASELYLSSSSGSIKGTLLSDKLFDVKTSSGNIDCPKSVKDGGKCTVKTASGNIKIKIAGW